jgi:hypothetical protein
MTPERAKVTEDYWFDNRLKMEAEAISRLIELDPTTAQRKEGASNG